jgi:hypothetical protein
MKKPIGLFILVGLLISSASPATAQSTQDKRKTPPAFSVTITPVEYVVKAGSPLRLTVEVRNETHHEITIAREATGRDTRIVVMDEHGDSPPDTEFGLARNGNVDVNRLPAQNLSNAWVPIKTGEKLSWAIDVTKWYDLTKPGRYSFFVFRFDDESKKEIKSKTVTVIVASPEPN